MDVKFSIIIPTYMEESLIEKTLLFYKGKLQDKYKYEIIVSDGGSTDATISIAKKYADKVVEFQAEWHKTIAEGRNRGAEVASSDLYFFINCDTLPKNTEYIFDLMNQFAERKGKYANFDALATKVIPFEEEKGIREIIFYSFINFYFKLLNTIGFGAGRGECQIIRKKYFDEVNGYRAEIAAGEDFDLFHRLTKICKVAFASDIVVYESTRRFKKYGYTKTMWLWSMNALSVWLSGKSISKSWEAIR